MKAPSAPARMTSTNFWSPAPAATPPMMTVVSLGTIGITESSSATPKMTRRNHQLLAISSSQSVKSVMTLEATRLDVARLANTMFRSTLSEPSLRFLYW